MKAKIMSGVSALLLAVLIGGCGTVSGIVAGPFTGGLNLASKTDYIMMKGPYFLGGTVAGPLAGGWKGVCSDYGEMQSVLEDKQRDWPEYNDVFWPFNGRQADAVRQAKK
ncbi:MAG: hypothetical protein KAS70_00015 [Planctomycetes bacterium]|nr:hypothetical protein [Planctomycetota bacterium]MCK5578471.1 hypothetical protein [Planctomycetota bacterium]